MIPSYFSPGDWLSIVAHLPRLPALLGLLIGASMLIVGLRFFRYYMCLGAGLAGWMGGTSLGFLMHVTPWFVALPTAGIALAAFWPVSKYASPILIGFVVGCSVGLLLVAGFEVDHFWVGFAVGLFVGVSLAVLANRFAVALFTSVWGTLLVVATLGAVVRAQSGWLAPAGYQRAPTVYLIAGPILFVAAMVIQVLTAPEEIDGEIEIGKMG